jgi:hypothetical protein
MSTVPFPGEHRCTCHCAEGQHGMPVIVHRDRDPEEVERLYRAHLLPVGWTIVRVQSVPPDEVASLGVSVQYLGDLRAVVDAPAAWLLTLAPAEPATPERVGARHA